MKFLFVTIYDHIVIGCRSIVGTLEQAGHECMILHFKRHDWTIIPRDELHEHPEIQRQEHGVLFRVLPEGNLYAPFPRIVTEEEESLFYKAIEEFQPDFLCFTLLSPYVHVAKRLSHGVKERFPDLPIIWGGIHVIFCPDDSIEYADIVCIGEGEDALIELAQNPTRTNIENLWFRKNGDIIRNQNRPLIADLDCLAFSSYGVNECLIEDNQFQTLPLEQNRKFYSDIFYVMTQRGCPYQCSYCTHATMRESLPHDKYLRRRSVEHVIRELEYQKPRLNLGTIPFVDDVLLVNLRWIKPFLEEYKKRINLPFGCYIHPCGGIEEMLGLAKDAGLVYVNVGIQSGSAYVLREIYNRHYSDEEMRRMCWRAHELGLMLLYDVIWLNPFENEQHMQETVEFLLTLPKPSVTHSFPLVFFPGLKIGNLNAPRYELPYDLQMFYALLYQYYRIPDVTPQMVRELMHNSHYKEHPEEMARWMNLLMQEHMHEQDNRIHGLQHELEQLTLELNHLRGNGSVRKKIVHAVRRLFTPSTS